MVIQNFVKGIVLGGVVAGLGLGVVSELTPMPSQQTAAAEQSIDTPVAQSTTETASAVAPVAPAAEGQLPADATVLAADAPDALADPAAPVVPDQQAVAAPESGAVVPSDLPVASSADAPKVAMTEEPNEALLAALPEAEAPAPALIEVDPPTGEAAISEPAAEGTPPDAAAPETALPETALPETALPETALPETALPEVGMPEVVVPLPKVLKPASGLPKTVEGVKVGGLPTVGTAPAPAAEEAAVATNDGLPITKFARPFNNEAAKPLFAVILQDTGAADLDRAKLAALPFAINFVIDPLDPTAAEAEKIYRAGGQEVLMMASGIPSGAKASDLEQSFQINDKVLPEAVALMDLGKGGFQGNRQLATQIVALLKEQGRGLVSFDQGLNAADQVARRDGVPSAMIFRELDAAGEDAPLIRRYLDRAAFKAAQEGRVVVLGSTRPETIAALMAWSVEGRGASVAIAPITAVMAKE